MKKIKDITRTVAPWRQIWPGDTPYHIQEDARMSRGDGNNVSSVTFSLHMGTHVDAPMHFVAGGTPVEQLDLDLFFGRAYVLDATDAGRVITVDYLRDRVPEDTTRLLLRTINSIPEDIGAFRTAFAACDEGALGWLAERGITLLGIDGPSAELFSEGMGAGHRAFLNRPQCTFLENVDLWGVEQGWYRLLCMPLKLEGLEGSPVRAILTEDA